MFLDDITDKITTKTDKITATPTGKKTTKNEDFED